MATEQHKATAKEYFDSNPSENVVHISSDGQVFFQKNYNDAVTHQRRIDDKEALVTVYRHQKSSDEAGAETTEDKGPDESWKKDEIADWLKTAGVTITGKEKKEELLALVAKVQSEEEEEEN